MGTRKFLVYLEGMETVIAPSPLRRPTGFLVYLEGMETFSNCKAGIICREFLVYLEGMETLYPATSLSSLRIVFSLPRRDGNIFTIVIAHLFSVFLVYLEGMETCSSAQSKQINSPFLVYLEGMETQ